METVFEMCRLGYEPVEVTTKVELIDQQESKEEFNELFKICKKVKDGKTKILLYNKRKKQNDLKITFDGLFDSNSLIFTKYNVGENVLSFYGTIRYTNRNIYVGVFKNDKRDGEGSMSYANGDKYTGVFKDDKRDGEGSMSYANGDKYEGDFKDDKRDGQGKITYTNGDKYTGDFKDDKRDGKGSMTYANGDIYSGDFKDDKRDGKGILLYGDRNIGGIIVQYSGNFKNDKRDGKGRSKYSNGFIYQGEFKDDKLNGQGKMKYVNQNGAFDKELDINTEEKTDEEFYEEGLFLIINNPSYKIPILYANEKKLELDGKGLQELKEYVITNNWMFDLPEYKYLLEKYPQVKEILKDMALKAIDLATKESYYNGFFGNLDESDTVDANGNPLLHKLRDLLTHKQVEQNVTGFLFKKKSKKSMKKKSKKSMKTKKSLKQKKSMKKKSKKSTKTKTSKKSLKQKKI
jgi:hypothetical protein